jgi:hypothetical protein
VGEIVESLAQFLGIPEPLVVAGLIFLAVWLVSWIFLPFSVWSISSKAKEANATLDRIRDETRRTAEGLDRLRERLDALARAPAGTAASLPGDKEGR